MRARTRAIGLVIAFVVTSCAASAGVVTERVDPLDGGDQGAGEPDSADPGGVDPDGDESGGDGIAWAPCAGSVGVGAGLDCGVLTVPLDYGDPGGTTIDIAVARAATAEDDERIGSLVFNPGGPGGSGIEFLETAALIMPPELASRFDLVSFDPRGVGASTAVDCEIELDDEIALLDEGDDEGWADLVADAEMNASTCTPETLAIAAALGTNNAARDLDELRAALGDDDLNYIGFSYGTRLGATYAELFPDRVRALVLDGAVKPTTDFAELGAEQGASLDRAFEAFAAECDADDDCVLGEVGPAVDVYEGLRADIAASGDFTTDRADRVLTPGELQLAVISALYSTQLWPVLAEGMHSAAVEQDGTLLQVLVDAYVGRQPDGGYDNSQAAGGAINCADDPARPPSDEVRQRSAEVASESRYFDEYLRASTGCIGQPAPIDPLIVGAADGAPPILVIGSTGDPATPYEWSVELAAFLSSAELFTVEADGHTAFLSVSCVEPVVVDYLVDLSMPDAGSSCADRSGDVFVPSGESDVDQVIAFFDCLRENGADVPALDVGDLLADPSGGDLLERIDPTDPVFGAAVIACEDLIPGS